MKTRFKTVAKKQKTIGLVDNTYTIWLVKEMVPKQLGRDRDSWVEIARFRAESQAKDYCSKKSSE